MAGHAPSQGTPKPRFVPRPWAQPPCVRVPRRSGSWDRGAAACVSVRARNLQKRGDARVAAPRRDVAGTHVQMVLVMPVSAPATNLRNGLRCVSPSAVSHCAAAKRNGARARQPRRLSQQALRQRTGAAASCAVHPPAGRGRLRARRAGALVRQLKRATRRHPTTAAHPRQRLVRGVVDGGVRDDAHHHRACRSPGAQRRPSGQPRLCQEPPKVAPRARWLAFAAAGAHRCPSTGLGCLRWTRWRPSGAQRPERRTVTCSLEK